MKPVLVVNGEQKEIYAMHYRCGKIQSITVREVYDVLKTYHDITENTQYYTEKPLQIDFKKCLKWVGRYDPIYDSIDKLLVEKGDELQDLAIEYIETKQPFSPSDLQQQYLLKQREQMGLMDAQDIISEFMEDDVDLSGGEDDVQRMQPF
ncbi:hypothetical protein ACPA0F_20420 [Solibacillus silvestris]